MPASKRPSPSDPSLERPPAINPRYARFRLSVKPSGIHRYGVFADELIPKGRKVIEYTGEKINRRETASRADRKLNYLFTLNSYWTLDGAVGGSGAEYVNHCCEPNCKSWVYRDHILYMSLRDIQPGEELTLDYRFDPDVERVTCRCGVPGCRGTINLVKVKKPRKKASKGVKKSASKR